MFNTKAFQGASTLLPWAHISQSSQCDMLSWALPRFKWGFPQIWKQDSLQTCKSKFCKFQSRSKRNDCIQTRSELKHCTTHTTRLSPRALAPPLCKCLLFTRHSKTLTLIRLFESQNNESAISSTVLITSTLKHKAHLAKMVEQPSSK